jgi:hypothetical protein
MFKFFVSRNIKEWMYKKIYTYSLSSWLYSPV